MENITQKTALQQPRKLTWIHYVFLICSVFIQREVLVFGSIDISALRNFSLIFPIPLALGMAAYCVCKDLRVSEKRLKIFLVFAVCFMITMVLCRDFRIGYFSMLAAYLNCVLLLTIFSGDEIGKFLYNAMFVVCLWSLIIFAATNLRPEVMEVFPKIENVGGMEFYFAGLTNSPVSPAAYYRNWGPFREPGVYQAFIVLALMYGLLRDPDERLIKPIVLIAAMISTFSTTGYFALAALLAAVFVVKRGILSKKKKTLLIMMTVLVGAVCAYLFLTTDLWDSVFGKLENVSDNQSSLSRVAGLTANWKMMMQSPLWGKGLSYVANNFEWVAYELHDFWGLTNTNTLFSQGARYGLFVFLYMSWRYYRGLRDQYKTNFLASGCVFGAFLCLLIGSLLQYTILFALPLFCLDGDSDPRPMELRKVRRRRKWHVR